MVVWRETDLCVCYTYNVTRTKHCICSPAWGRSVGRYRRDSSQKLNLFTKCYYYYIEINLCVKYILLLNILVVVVV